MSISTGLFAADIGLGRCDARNRNAKGTTGHIIQADIVTEPDRARVAAVLATDAVLDTLFLAPALVSCHLH